MRLSVDFSRTSGTAPQVPSVRTDLCAHLHVQISKSNCRFEMPRYGRADAIYFFKTSVEVLRSSRGDIYIPKLESLGAGNEILDQKSLSSLGNVKNIGTCGAVPVPSQLSY